MPQALLFLLLLLLGAGSSTLSTVPSGLGDDDRAAARALLAELAELVPPRALPGFSCWDPTALPGFARLPLPPRALARAALALALLGAACAPQAEEEVRGLSRELGPPAAAALLRRLARLRGAPAPPTLALLLLSLACPGGSATAGPCAAPKGPAAPTHPRAPAAAPLAEGLPGGAGARARPLSRRRREEADTCDPPGEQEAHGVLEWVPGVSTFYNLGTSLYFALRGCQARASARALAAAEELGYAGLAALGTGLGAPAGLGLQLGLKAGVRALLGYLTGDPPPAPTAHSGPVTGV